MHNISQSVSRGHDKEEILLSIHLIGHYITVDAIACTICEYVLRNSTPSPLSIATNWPIRLWKRTFLSGRTVLSSSIENGSEIWGFLFLSLPLSFFFSFFFFLLLFFFLLFFFFLFGKSDLVFFGRRRGFPPDPCSSLVRSQEPWEAHHRDSGNFCGQLGNWAVFRALQLEREGNTCGRVARLGPTWGCELSWDFDPSHKFHVPCHSRDTHVPK